MPGSDSDGFLNVPVRSPKPRERGITHVMDKGLTVQALTGLFESAGEYVDILKLGWGTAYVTNNLRAKVELCRSYGTPVVCGGTLFEAVVGLGKLDEYKRWLTDHGITHVEVSDGTVGLDRDEKLALIAELARDFVVLSEVGSKDEATVFAPYQWVHWIREELEAGAWKVITEGREGGTAGIFRPNGEVRTGLIDEIAHELDVADVIFEAPTKASEGYFVRVFGPEVNLGNIPPEEVIPLETLRLGLRADTLKEVLLREQPAAAD
jgi:phosphosulfolactate synthase